MFRALFAHHQELMETVYAAYGAGMRYLVLILTKQNNTYVNEISSQNTPIIVTHCT